MSIRNIVKVMNFHALIRVDFAKRQAEKYRMMEDQLFRMMSAITNNRNLILDKMIMKPDKNGPEINIYLGSDFGFCSNFNSQMADRLSKDEGRNLKVIVGKKLISRKAENAEFRLIQEEFEKKIPEVEAFLKLHIDNKDCSRINLIYNHYENTSTIYARKLQIYPVDRIEEGKGENEYTKEDFAVEGDINTLLKKMIMSYVHYEIMLALVSSKASENILRQNATTESLKKIDELEEEKLMERRREKAGKEFQKVVDNFVKTKVY